VNSFLRSFLYYICSKTPWLKLLSYNRFQVEVTLNEIKEEEEEEGPYPF